MSFGLNPSGGTRMGQAREDDRIEARHDNHNDEIKQIAAEALSLLHSDPANGINNRGKRSIEEVKFTVPDKRPSSAKNSKLEPIPTAEKIPSFEGKVPPGYTGLGKVTFASGNVYEGQFQNGNPDGQGKVTYVDGGASEGQFQNGKLHGQGKITYVDGNVYEGQLRNGKLDDQGKVTRPDGKAYEAQFQNDMVVGVAQWIN